MVHVQRGLAASAPGSGRSAPRPPALADANGTVPVRAIDSAKLLNGSRELCIAHAGEIYRLRLTRQNKLILTK